MEPHRTLERITWRPTVERLRYWDVKQYGLSDKRKHWKTKLILIAERSMWENQKTRKGMKSKYSQPQKTFLQRRVALNGRDEPPRQNWNTSNSFRTTSQFLCRSFILHGLFHLYADTRRVLNWFQRIFCSPTEILVWNPNSCFWQNKRQERFSKEKQDPSFLIARKPLIMLIEHRAMGKSCPHLVQGF